MRVGFFDDDIKFSSALFIQQTGRADRPVGIPYSATWTRRLAVTTRRYYGFSGVMGCRTKAHNNHSLITVRHAYGVAYVQHAHVRARAHDRPAPALLQAQRLNVDTDLYRTDRTMAFVVRPLMMTDIRIVRARYYYTPGGGGEPR